MPRSIGFAVLFVGALFALNSRIKGSEADEIRALLKAKGVSIDALPDRDELVATLPTNAAGKFTPLVEVAPLLKRLPGVVAIDLTNAALPEDSLAALDQLPSVDTLVLRRCTKVDRALASIPQTLGLAAIDLEGSDITDAGVAHLGKFRELRELNLQSTRITSRSLQSITGLIRLQTLNLARTYALREDSKGLAPFTSLRTLDLTNTGADDSTLESLVGASGLRVLKLTSTAVRNDGCRHLAAFKHLTTLDLQGTRVWGDGIKSLRGLKNLSDLRIDSHLETALALLEIKSELPSLDTTPFVLWSIRTEFTRDEKGRVTSLSLRTTKRFDVLRKLCEGEGLSDVVQIGASDTFDDKECEMLMHFPRLQEVDLVRASVTDSCVDVLLKLPKLGRVSFRTGQLSSAGIERVQSAGIRVDLIPLAEPRQAR